MLLKEQLKLKFHLGQHKNNSNIKTKQIKLIMTIEARQYCVWRTIIVSSVANLRLLYSFMDKLFRAFR